MLSCVLEQTRLNLVLRGVPFSAKFSEFVQFSPPPYSTYIPSSGLAGFNKPYEVFSNFPRDSQVSVGCLRTSRTSLTVVSTLVRLRPFALFVVVATEIEKVNH